jgi:ribosomal protein S3
VIGVKVWIYKGEVFDLHAAAAESASDKGPHKAQAK